MKREFTITIENKDLKTLKNNLIEDQGGDIEMTDAGVFHYLIHSGNCVLGFEELEELFAIREVTINTKQTVLDRIEEYRKENLHQGTHLELTRGMSDDMFNLMVTTIQQNIKMYAPDQTEYKNYIGRINQFVGITLVELVENEEDAIDLGHDLGLFLSNYDES